LQLINILYLVRLLTAFYGKRIAVAVFTKPDGSSPHSHSVFCSKFIETKTSGTVRADQHRNFCWRHTVRFASRMCAI